MKERLFTKNFTLLVLGQVSSLFGNYILKLALSMYVLEMTGSAAVFASMLSIATVPTILLSPFGGILADRMDRGKIMVALDALSGVSVLCAALFFDRDYALAVIGGLLVILSVLGAFETPTVQACIPVMLTGEAIIRGNAVVNQVASLSYLTAPFLGGILYTAFGLKPVMYASVACFFITAFLECFIRIGAQKQKYSKNLCSMIKEDFICSVQFMVKKQTNILKLLLLAAVSRFFVMGITLVGLPFLVRTVLGFDAQYYGAAESTLAIAVIAGSILAGLLSRKLTPNRLSFLLVVVGICMFAAGAAFLLPLSNFAKYIVLVMAYCGIQMAISIFSIFAVSLIQQHTPDELLGKVMAYTASITLCAQPIGQMVYGVIFDSLKGEVYLVFLFTGIAVCVIAFVQEWVKMPNIC